MLEQVFTWIQKSPIRQALLLAFIQAYGWLWIHVLFQNSIIDGPNASADMGLGVIIPAWFWALIWGWLVCWPVARRIIGRSSTAGYITAAVLFMPELVLVNYCLSIPFWLFGAMPPSPFNNSTLSTLFRILGAGVLSERRGGTAAFDAFMFLGMFIASFGGFLKTARIKPVK